MNESSSIDGERDMRGSAGPAGSTLELLDEDAARTFLEHFRWPNGPVCPHCGSLGAYRLHPKARSTAPVRNGVLKCKACRRQFTVTVGTAFERSHVPLSTWLLVIRRLCASGQALSAYQLHKLVGVSRQSAWLMARRIREAVEQRAARRRAARRTQVSNLDEKVASLSTQAS